MTTTFRALETPFHANRKDEILRAAVTAFAALSKPSKRDCAQIEDLLTPILPQAGDAARRYACAALSDSALAPARLLMALCDAPADVCAPLLLKSPALSAIDLVSLIGRHGKGHARIIAKRNHLPNDVIEALARLDDPLVLERVSLGAASADKSPPLGNIKAASAEDARQILAGLVLGKPEADALPAQRTDAQRLIRLALRDEAVLFATALADQTGVSLARIAKMIRRTGSGELIALLRAAELTTEEAFTVACALNPAFAASKADISLFRERYLSLNADRAEDMIRQWKAEDISLALKRAAVNSSAAADKAIKAS